MAANPRSNKHSCPQPSLLPPHSRGLYSTSVDSIRAHVSSVNSLFSRCLLTRCTEKSSVLVNAPCGGLTSCCRRYLCLRLISGCRYASPSCLKLVTGGRSGFVEFCSTIFWVGGLQEHSCFWRFPIYYDFSSASSHCLDHRAHTSSFPTSLRLGSTT